MSYNSDIPDKLQEEIIDTTKNIYWAGDSLGGDHYCNSIEAMLRDLTIKIKDYYLKDTNNE